MIDTAHQHSAARRWLQGAISLGLVVFIFAWALPRLTDYGEIWEAIRSLSASGLAVVGLAFVFNLATYWWVLVVSLPGLSYPKAAVAHQTATAVAHVVPAGGAVAVGLNYAVYTSWGFGTHAIARSVLITGLWNNLVKFAFPVVALGLLAVSGDASTALVVAAAFGLVLLVGTIVTLGLALRRDRLSRTLGRQAASVVSSLRRLIGREPVTGWEEGASRFRADAHALLADRWAQLTVATLASQTAIFLVLGASLWAIGVTSDQVTWIEALAAFSFVRLASALPITPGGLGIIELGLLAALTTDLGERPTAAVAAAILLFRFASFVMPVVLGGFTYIVWRRKLSWRKPAATD